MEHTVGLRTMCRVGLEKDLCFCGSGRECVYERKRERERGRETVCEIVCVRVCEGV